MSTRDIAKIFNISPTTVLYWVKKKFSSIKDSLNKTIKKPLPHYTIQCDELWTFTGNKKKKKIKFEFG